MIRIVDVPKGFVFPVTALWHAPVNKAEDLQDNLGLDDVAYDLASNDAVVGPYFYVGLGKGTACHVMQATIPQIPSSFCPHCGAHLQPGLQRRG
jgi:hypothetical protein